MTLTLSVAELWSCWHRLGLGDPPLALELGPLGGSDEWSRAALVDGAFAGLARRGLIDRRGPVPSLAAALRMLATSEHTVDVRLTGGFGRLAGVGAVGPRRGVLVTRSFGTDPLVTVRPVRDVAAAVAAVPGPLHPGRELPVNIAADVLDQAVAATLAGPDRTSHWYLADQLVARGVHHADANSLARMCTGISASGQIGATVHVAGRAHRSPWVVGLHRAAAGDFFQVRRRGTVTVAPADGGRLVDHIHQLSRAALQPVAAR